MLFPQILNLAGIAQPLMYLLGLSEGPKKLDELLGKSGVTQGMQNTGTSLAGKYLGTNLTGQERESAELNFQNQLRMMREGPRAQVEGAEVAGINPVFALTGQAHTPSVGNTSSISSGGSLSDIVALFTLPAQMKLMNKQADNIEADTNKKKSETAGQNISNEFAAELAKVSIDVQKSVRDLNRQEINDINSRIDERVASIQKMLKEVENYQSEMELRASQILLNNASAYRIAELVPYEKLELQARSESERAAAQASLAHAAYENGLINGGYIAAMCKSLNAEASIKDVEAFYRDPSHSPASSKIEHVIRSIEAAVYNSVKFLSPMK